MLFSVDFSCSPTAELTEMGQLLTARAVRFHAQKQPKILACSACYHIWFHSCVSAAEIGSLKKKKKKPVCQKCSSLFFTKYVLLQTVQEHPWFCAFSSSFTCPTILLGCWGLRTTSADKMCRKCSRKYDWGNRDRKLKEYLNSMHSFLLLLHYHHVLLPNVPAWGHRSIALRLRAVLPFSPSKKQLAPKALNPSPKS